MTELFPLGLAIRVWLDERDDLAPATVESYQAHLASFSAHVGPIDLAQVTAGHLRAWLRSMDVADSTKNTRMATLRSFFGWAAEPGPDRLIPWDPTRQVRRYRVPQGPVPVANGDDLARVLELASGRNRTVMLLILQTGIRRGEIARTKIEHYDARRGRLLIHGKGNKQRYVEVPAEAAQELAIHLAYLGRRSGPLFPSTHRPGKGLADSTYTHIVADAGRQCGVHLWPHLLRHQALTDAAERGATAWELQRQAGHAYSSTTDRYVHVADGSVARAMAGRSYRRKTAGPNTSAAMPNT
jgi:integrase